MPHTLLMILMKAKTSAPKYFECVAIPSHWNKNFITIPPLCTTFGPIGLLQWEEVGSCLGWGCGTTLPHPLIENPAHAYEYTKKKKRAFSVCKEVSMLGHLGYALVPCHVECPIFCNEHYWCRQAVTMFDSFFSGGPKSTDYMLHYMCSCPSVAVKDECALVHSCMYWILITSPFEVSCSFFCLFSVWTSAVVDVHVCTPLGGYPALFVTSFRCWRWWHLQY